WPEFDEEDVVSFLEEFDEIAEAHGIHGKRRCVKLKYCLPKDKVGEVTLYEGYLRGDWEQLKKDLLYAFPQTVSSSKRLLKKLKELTKERWTLDGLRSKVLMYQSLVRATNGANMSNDVQANTLIHTLPKVLERKMIDNTVEGGVMPPLAKVAEKILAEAANVEYWAEVAEGNEEEPPQKVARKPEPEAAPKTEPSAEMSQMMEKFERMTLNLLRIAENNSKRPYKENQEWNPNCYYCNSPGHRRYDCAEFVKDKNDGLFTVGERGRILDKNGNIIRIDTERGIMYHVRNQKAHGKLVRGVSVSPEAATLCVKSVPEEVIGVPSEWDCPVVVDGITYQ
ncbi:hypothetical protein IWQ62_006749, partial [Dispira parvispora]